MSEHFAAARAALESVADAVDHAEGKLAEDLSAAAQAVEKRVAAEAELAAVLQAIDAADAAHRAKCAERERELRSQEAELVERERAADEKHQRAEATMRTIEHARADMGNRIRGVA
jgi:aminoglycoside phosphotransferase (APT) family kinase protein